MQPHFWFVEFGRTWWAQISMAEIGVRTKRKIGRAEESWGVIRDNLCFFLVLHPLVENGMF
jgi:hypothetical protein